MVGRLLSVLSGEVPRPDWVEELPVEYGRAGEPIYSRINATHQDQVLRRWKPTLIRQWRATVYRTLPPKPWPVRRAA